MEPDALIYIAGHQGLVGSALMRALKSRGFKNFITRTHEELELTDQAAVYQLFDKEKPDYVFLAAAKVGGIFANSQYPAEFIYDNLQVQTNVIHTAWQHGVKKLLFLGSSCIYPKFANQPMDESQLLTGSLEPTNEWYAIAKIAGIKMCQAYHTQYGFNAISVMPTNLFGPGDNFNLENSHVIPALIRKFHEAKVNNKPRVEVWGSGSPRREFLYVDDLAEACIFLMEQYDNPEIINVGMGKDIDIKSLAELIGQITGFEGEIMFDPAKPDGTPQKLLDTTKINQLGWSAQTNLEQGLKMTYDWYCKLQDDLN